MENVKGNSRPVEALVGLLAETSRHLAETATVLASNAVPAGLPIELPKGVPPSETFLTTALPPGVPVKISSQSGIPAAKVLGESAVPIARLAKPVASAVPLFAPVLQ